MRAPSYKELLLFLNLESMEKGKWENGLQIFFTLLRKQCHEVMHEMPWTVCNIMHPRHTSTYLLLLFHLFFQQAE